MFNGMTYAGLIMQIQLDFGELLDPHARQFFIACLWQHCHSGIAQTLKSHWVPSPAQPYRAVRVSTSLIASFSLSFSICKMGVVIPSVEKGGCVVYVW